MKPNENWIDNWRLGLAPAYEGRLGRGLIELFSEFWLAEGLDAKSKSTRQRYSNGLGALGGYLVKEALDEEGREPDHWTLLAEHLDGREAPLIFVDEPVWQAELDTVCRKLYKYLVREGLIERS